MDRLAQLFAQPALTARTLAMPMDAYRQDDRFVVSFDIPGVDPDNIELTVERDSLSVRAERRWQPAEGQQVIVAERPQGVFSRQLILGANLDTENVQATYDRGVLTLTIPVAEQSRPRRIDVSMGDGSRTLSAGESGGGTASATGESTSKGQTSGSPGSSER